MTEKKDYRVNHYQTNVSSEWSQKLVELLWNTQETMFNAQQARRNLGNGYTQQDKELAEQRFNQMLERLVLRTKYKFRKKKKIETPEPIEDDKDVTGLSLEEKAFLVDKITELLEELEFTSVEKQVHSKPGFGEEA